MRRGADEIRTQYGEYGWDDDFTWENEHEIHLRFDHMVIFVEAKVYC